MIWEINNIDVINKEEEIAKFSYEEDMFKFIKDISIKELSKYRVYNNGNYYNHILELFKYYNYHSNEPYASQTVIIKTKRLKELLKESEVVK